MLRSFTKLSTPHTVIAIDIPNDIAVTISSVLMALLSPIWIWLSIISDTKFISGTPGTMNNAHAMSGCHGVSVCKMAYSHSGRYCATAGVDINVESHARSVDTNAAIPMFTYPLDPFSLR